MAATHFRVRDFLALHTAAFYRDRLYRDFTAVQHKLPGRRAISRSRKSEIRYSADKKKLKIRSSAYKFPRQMEKSTNHEKSSGPSLDPRSGPCFSIQLSLIYPKQIESPHTYLLLLSKVRILRTIMSRDPSNIDAIVIGAGPSGIALAYQLKRQLNFQDFTIYDKLDGVGGTWRANTYPGW